MNRVIIVFVFISILIIPSKIDSFSVDNNRIVLLDRHKFRGEITAQFDPILGFRLKPGVSMNGFRHNSYGFIGPEFNKEKPERIFRIFCLGGSTTLGAGVMADMYSYPEILQAIFNKTAVDESSRIEIINAGVFGYNSLHTSIQITTLLGVYHPDMYIVMDGLNDLDLANNLSVTMLQNLSGQKISKEAVDDGLQGLEEKFYLVGYKRNIQNAISYAKDKNIQVVLVSDPLQTTPDHATQLSKDNPDLASLLGFGRKTLPEINRALAKENGISFIDAQPVLDAYLTNQRLVNRVWTDGLHLTRYGYYLLARTIYHRLMTFSAIQDAAGTRQAVSDAELDLLFPELVHWRPADGMGWAKTPCMIHGEFKANNAKDPNPDDAWSFFTPSDPAVPAEISLALDPGVEAFRVYPRIESSADSVAVFHVLPDGERRPLFSLQKPTDDGLWSPQTAWYEVRAPKERDGTLVIRLTGENAQLWRNGKAVLFAPEPRE